MGRGEEELSLFGEAAAAARRKSCRWRVVVHAVDLEMYWDLSVALFRNCASSALVCGGTQVGDHLPGGDLQRCEQVRGPVAEAVLGGALRACPTTCQWWRPWAASSCGWRSPCVLVFAAMVVHVIRTVVTPTGRQTSAREAGLRG